MSSVGEEIAKELNLLKLFSSSNLRAGSVVSSRVDELIREISEEVKAKTRLSGNAKRSGDSITIILFIGLLGYKDPRPLQVLPTTTLSQLKLEIEKITGSNFATERIKVKRTGKALGQFDTKTLGECEIKDRDEILVDCRNVNEVLNPTGVDRIATSGIQPKTACELLVLALHAFMLDEEFITVVQLPSSVPGFAPSIKGTVS